MVVGAAACHSIWNLVLKSESHRSQVLFGALIVGVVCTSPVFFVYPLRDIPLEAWLIVMLSGAFETAYVIALTAAYNAGDLSLVYPIARGTPALLMAPLSVLLLGERLSATGVFGILLVVTGIFVMGGAARPPGDGAGGRPGTALEPHRRRAILLALLTGLTICAYSLLNKRGVALVPVPLYAALVFVIDAVLLAIVLWMRREPLFTRRRHEAGARRRRADDGRLSRGARRHGACPARVCRGGARDQHRVDDDRRRGVAGGACVADAPRRRRSDLRGARHHRAQPLTAPRRI